MKAVVNSRFWFLKKDLDMDQVGRLYDRRFYEERACGKCEHRPNRFDALTCGECPAYKGRVVTYAEREDRQGREWVGLPRGDTHNYHKAGVDWGSLKLTDKRTRRPMRSSLLERIEWKVTLTPNQKQLADAYLSGSYQHQHTGLREPYGHLVAPPRTGKTILCLYIAIKLGLKTLVIANQDDLLKNFVDDLRKATNIQDIEQFDGRIYHGIAKTAEQIKNLDIAMCTWQSLASELGKARLEAIKDHVGLIIVDEAHRSAASKFAGVVNAFPSFARLAVTATPDRKDGFQYLSYKTLGPVVAEGHVETMKPRWSLHLTQVTAHGRKATFWPAFISHLHSSERRIRLIERYLERDLRDGRTIVMPVTRRKVAIEWADRVRKLGYTAEAFVAGANRQQLVDRAKAGEIQFICGIRSILSTGINIPRLDCLFEIEPISNDPNFYQEYSRICTPMEGKRQPIIRMFVDDIGPSYGCFKTCYRRLSKMKPLNKETEERARAIMSGKKPGEPPQASGFTSMFRKKRS